MRWIILLLALLPKTFLGADAATGTPAAATDAPAAAVPPASPTAPAATSAPAPANPPAPARRGGGRRSGPQATAPLPPTVEPGATVTKLADGFRFTEGTTAAPNGDVYFVDQPNNRIMKWSVADKKLSVFKEPSNYSNGMCFDAQGNLIACADEKNELWSIAPDGAVTVLAGTYQDKPFNGPNDVWVAPDGSMYFTDPYYQRRWWAHTTPPQDGRQVYHLAPDRKTVTRVTDDRLQPNGIIGTPDGKTLFVADFNARRTFKYDIEAGGKLANGRVFCEFASDGMTLDDQGNLYLTSGPWVTVINKDGQLAGAIPVPESTANVCFGGPNHDTLYIAANTGFYSIPTKVKGANKAK